jgi:hypothetical protein
MRWPNARFRSKLPAAVLAVGIALFAGLPIADAQAPSYLYVTTTDTALDTQTGLLWQRAALQQFSQSFTDALLGCQGLNLGGYSSGWRLPTIRELLSIVDERQPLGPQWDRNTFTGGPLSSYWSSTPVAATPASAWVFTFTPGVFMEQRDMATSAAMVRCVH